MLLIERRLIMNNRVFAEDLALVIGSVDRVPTKLELPLVVTKDFREIR